MYPPFEAMLTQKQQPRTSTQPAQSSNAGVIYSLQILVQSKKLLDQGTPFPMTTCMQQPKERYLALSLHFNRKHLQTLNLLSFIFARSTKSCIAYSKDTVYNTHNSRRWPRATGTTNKTDQQLNIRARRTNWSPSASHMVWSPVENHTYSL